MIKLKTRRDKKSLIKDPVTHRELWRLTDDSEYHDIHPYYDISPWSPDGKQILFSSMPVRNSHDTGKWLETEDGELFTMNADGSGIRWLAGGIHMNSHVGCFPMWSTKGRHVFYGNSNRASRACCILDIETGFIQTYEGISCRQISPDGESVVCESNRGIEILSPKTGERRILVSFDEIVAKVPGYSPGAYPNLVAANIKWSRCGAKLMFRFSGGPGGWCTLKSLFVVNRDGSQLTRLTEASHRFHHHSWHPNGETIVYGDWNASGTRPGIYFLDKDRTTKHRISQEALHGHPTVSPDGKKILTDNYDLGYNAYGNSLLLIDRETGVVEKLASLGNTVKRLDAHPTWSKDGTQILFHSDHEGTSNLYLIEMD